MNRNFWSKKFAGTCQASVSKGLSSWHATNFKFQDDEFLEIHRNLIILISSWACGRIVPVCSAHAIRYLQVFFELSNKCNAISKYRIKAFRKSCREVLQPARFSKSQYDGAVRLLVSCERKGAVEKDAKVLLRTIWSFSTSGNFNMLTRPPLNENSQKKALENSDNSISSATRQVHALQVMKVDR